MSTPPRCCAALDGIERWLSPGFFKALADPSRIAVLVALASSGRGEQTVSAVAACCPVDLSVVSRHLRTLRDAGIVEARKDGKEVRYRVRFEALVSMLRNLADALERCCPPERPARPITRATSRARGGRTP